MTLTEFKNAYNSGKIKIEIDPGGTAKYLSARLLLPFVMMPVLSTGVALALTGRIWTGMSVIAAGILVPRIIKRSAINFVLTQALEDERVFNDVTQPGVLRISLLAETG